MQAEEGCWKGEGAGKGGLLSSRPKEIITCDGGDAMRCNALDEGGARGGGGGGGGGHAGINCLCVAISKKSFDVMQIHRCDLLRWAKLGKAEGWAEQGTENNAQSGHLEVIRESGSCHADLQM